MPAKHVTANECIQGHGSSGVPQPFINRDGALPAYGLARNVVVQAAGQYTSTEVLGFTVSVAASGDWSITPVGGSQVTGVNPGTFAAGQTYPIHCTAITVGTGGEALLYIPET